MGGRSVGWHRACRGVCALFNPRSLLSASNFPLPTNRMKFSLLHVLGLSLALGCSPAYATLIGDTITIARHNPTLGTVVTSQSVVVQAGTADVVTSSFLNIDPDANGIAISMIPSASGTTFIPASFNGFVVTGIDATITGFSVHTNIGGWSDSRVAFDAHSISMNFERLAFFGPAQSVYPVMTFFLTLNLAPKSTPDGGATVTMLGLAVLGLTALRRWVA